jgi:hypothetical protein
VYYGFVIPKNKCVKKNKLLTEFTAGDCNV